MSFGEGISAPREMPSSPANTAGANKAQKMSEKRAERMAEHSMSPKCVRLRSTRRYTSVDGAQVNVTRISLRKSVIYLTSNGASEWDNKMPHTAIGH